MGGAEAITTALILGGVVFVALALRGFVVGERYRSPRADLGPVEREWAVREVEEALAELAPRVLALGEGERAVELALRDGGADEARVTVRDRLGRADLGGFWDDFARVSALAGEEPIRALSELRRVGARLDGCLEEVEEIARVLDVGRGGRAPVEGGEDDTG